MKAIKPPLTTYNLLENGNFSFTTSACKMAMDGSLCLCDWGLIDLITCPKCPKQIRVRWSVIMRLQNLNSSLWETGFIMRKKDYLGSALTITWFPCLLHPTMTHQDGFKTGLQKPTGDVISFILSILRKCCHTPNFKLYKYLYITKKFTSFRI